MVILEILAKNENKTYGIKIITKNERKKNNIKVYNKLITQEMMEKREHKKG